jgi:tetratricopeptide (TPR) repeat protein
MRISAINIILCLTLSLGVTFPAIAQKASVTCTVNQNPVTTGNRVQLIVTLSNCKAKGVGLNRLDVPGLNLLGGPAISQQTSIVNFKSTSSISYTFTYQVISKTDVKIPAVKLSTSKGVMNSKPFILRVNARGAEVKKSGFGHVESVIDVNKKRVHLGEPITIKYLIYSRYNGLRYRENIPELEGFWKEVLPARNPNQSIKVIGGIEYIQTVVREVLAFPQQTGTFVIDGFDIQGVVSINFFNQKEVNAESNSVSVIVVPLPEGKPSGFMGTFGNLRVEADVDVDSVMVNEAFNFELTYSGMGNLKLVQEPELVWPVEFEVFDPEIIDRINVQASGETGKRTFKYAVIPRAPGVYQLPKLSASFYEYSSDKFISTNADAGTIIITRDTGSNGGETTFSPKSQVQVLNHDIRHISTSHGHWGAHNDSKLASKLMWLLYIIGPGLAGLTLVGRRRRNAEANDKKGTRNKRASKEFKKALKQCEKAEDREDAYTMLGEAIECYLCAKFGWGRSSFSRATAAQNLEKQLSPAEAKAWDGLLEKCEMARFAPGSVPEPGEAIDEARRLASESDNKMKIMGAGVIALLIALMPNVVEASTQHQGLDSQFEYANSAYLDGNYELAVTTYEEIAVSHKCFELEYNLGNTHYKLENIGEAILHYERAKLIDPLDDNLRANILLADLRAIDKIESLPGVGLERVMEVVFAGKMYGVWFLLSLLLWTVGFGMIAMGYKWPNNALKPFINSGATICILSSLVFSSLLFSTHKRMSQAECAIVMEDKIDLMSIPGDTGLKLFHLHEGAKGCILSEEGVWTELRLENGNVGWLRSSAIEPI